MSGTQCSPSSLYKNMDFGIQSIENREWAVNVYKLQYRADAPNGSYQKQLPFGFFALKAPVAAVKDITAMI